MNTQFVPINIDLIPCAEELHVVPSTGTGGRGIASDPLMIPKGDLDIPGFLQRLLVPSLKIVFGEGKFFTNGFALPLNTCVIIGQGADRTTIQNKDNIDSVQKNRNWPHIRMIADFAQWCLNFGIRDITLDGNWRGQPWATSGGNSKVEPLVVNSVRGKSERVDIVDCGSHGSKEIYGNVGLEAFFLALQTVSMGPPFHKYLPEHSGRGEEPASFIEIAQCRVLSATFLGGGYCTGQFVVTNQPGQGDRLPKGARTTLAAWVHDNYVADINGIAFGCAHAEHVLFERNHAVGNRVGFNCDTGRCENIVLRENRFIGNSHGVNFSPDGGGDVFTFEKNTVIAGPKSTNPITGAPEGYIGLSVGNTIAAFSRKNTFIGPADWKDRVFSNYPVLSENDDRLIIGGPPPAPTPFDDTLTAALQITVNDLTAQRDQLIDRNGVLISEAASATAAIRVWEKKLSEEVERTEFLEQDRDANKRRVETLEDAIEDYVHAQDALKNLTVTDLDP